MVVALALGFPILLAACGSREPAATYSSGGGTAGDRCAVALGVFGALTGNATAVGTTVRDGVRLAVDRYNGRHSGCTVGFAEFDSRGSVDQAPMVATRAIDDHRVIGVVGPVRSDEAAAAVPLFEEAGLPIITPSATEPTLGAQHWRVFHRVVGDDDTQGRAATRYVTSMVKARRVFVVHDGTTYGRSLATSVTAGLGSAVVGTTTLPPHRPAAPAGMARVVEQVLASGAEAVYFGGSAADAGVLRRELTDAGGGGITLVAGDAVRDESFVTGAGSAAAEGTVLTCGCSPPDRVGGTFFADFTTAYRAAPGMYAAEAYDAATVFLDGIDAGSATRTSLLDWTNRYDKPGLTTRLAFDAAGEPRHPVVWAYGVRGGRIVPLQVIP